MREKYEILSAAVLRDIAKSRGLKGLSGLRKEELIERMLEEDERERQNNAVAEEPSPQAVSQPAPQPEMRQAPAERTTVNENTYSSGRTYTARPQEGRGYDNRQPGNRPNRTYATGQYSSRQTYSAGSYNNNNYNSSYNNSSSGNGGYSNNGYSSYNRSQDNSRSQDYRSQDNRSQDNNRYQDNGQRQDNGYNNGFQQRGYNRPQDQRRPMRQEAPAEPTPEQIAAQEARMAEIREADVELNTVKEDLANLDSGIEATGILEIMPDGFGFLRSANYMPGDSDIYVSPSQIRRFNLKTGDMVSGNTRVKTEKEKFGALLYVNSVNGYHPTEAQRRPVFEKMTPVFPNQRIHLEREGGSTAMRIVDVVSPIGKGQRGMIVSQPKAGKTTLLKEIAKSVKKNNPEMRIIILLIDERPEEVTDIREEIEGENVEVIYSTFDETPQNHKRVSEMTIERAKRLVEHKQDVMILLDSITRLARAYNLTVTPSGRTLSGGLDPAALHMPKRFFGAARNMREGGSLTILATALVDTGSKMDDVVFEEFKGTGNMELVLDRKLSEKRVFPAIDIVKSGTRREDLLLDPDEQIAVDNMRRAFNGMKADEAVETILNIFAHTKSNFEFVSEVKKNRLF